jgi:hypothetical protein
MLILPSSPSAAGAAGLRHCSAFSQRFATIAWCLINIKVAIAGSDNLARTEVAYASQRSSPMPLPPVLKRIRLELARSKEFPLGSTNHGYEFVAPLDGKGRVDPHLWQKYREHCGVRRFWSGWRLTHKPGGAEHARWVFDYDPDTTADDEAGYRFGAHAFAPGEYVSIRGHEGGSHTFKVISVEPAV